MDRQSRPAQAQLIPIDCAIPWRGAQSLLVNNAITIAHMATTSPAMRAENAIEHRLGARLLPYVDVLVALF